MGHVSKEVWNKRWVYIFFPPRLYRASWYYQVFYLSNLMHQKIKTYIKIYINPYPANVENRVSS